MRRNVVAAGWVCLGLMLVLNGSAWGRGFGGGFRGGGHPSMGSFHPNMGSFHPNMGSFHPNMGSFHPNMGNMRSPMGMGGAGGFGGAAGGYRGGFSSGGYRPGGVGGFPGAGAARGFDARGFDARGLSGAGALNREPLGSAGHAPTRSSLNSFLGLPSDEGLHSLSGAAGRTGDGFQVHHGSVTGPRGGEAAGTAVTGPRGNTVARGAAEGPRGGTVAGRGVVGADGGAAGQAVARGPGGRVAAGSAVRGPEGGMAARGVVAGPRGYAAGFARVSPAGRYATAASVRNHWNHWGYYDRRWFGAHPGAWYARRWLAAEAWMACAWYEAALYCGYAGYEPMYYDYGTNIVYEDNSVIVNGQNVGSAQQYYDQASQLAATGTQAEAPEDGDWLPLGVFALSKSDASKSDLVVQLAVNRAGILRGNYTDTLSDRTQPIHGSVDKANQRVAFTVGDNKHTVLETGLYNLTKDEAPCLIHQGSDSTEQWLLIRLTPPAGSASAEGAAAGGAPSGAAPASPSPKP
ncbi:MAG: protocadherin [Pirellulales bacterium]